MSQNTDLLSLEPEGRKISSALQLLGYKVEKTNRELTWTIEYQNRNYSLVWLPAPVGDWSVIPNNNTLTRFVRIARSINQGDLKKSQSVLTQYERVDLPEDFTRPWAIVRLLPDMRRYTVARFHNRQDAHDHMRLLNRMMPAAEFAIIFDIPPNCEQSY